MEIRGKWANKGKLDILGPKESKEILDQEGFKEQLENPELKDLEVKKVNLDPEELLEEKAIKEKKENPEFQENREVKDFPENL